MNSVSDLILKGHFARLKDEFAAGEITDREGVEKLKIALEIIGQIQTKNPELLTENQKKTYSSIVEWLESQSDKQQIISALSDNISSNRLNIKLDTKPMKKASGKKTNGVSSRRKIS